jgi:hypothetical protein
MAGVEDLSGAELQAFQLGKLLLGNPEVRREAQRLAKKANPALQIPEIELEDRVTAERTERLASEKKLEEALMGERVARRKSERDAQIVAAGFTVEEIEKIIVDEKCSYETALKIAAMMRQTAEPTPPDVRHGTAPGEPINLRPGEDWKKLDRSGAKTLGLKLAHEMVDDLRKTRRAAR